LIELIRAKLAEIDQPQQGVAEGLPQTLRKVVPGHAKREIDKKMDAEKFGKTDADKDANFQRYKKIQDKLKEQGVAEGAPELLKAEMPLVRHIEQELTKIGYKKGTPEFNAYFNDAIKFYRKFGNFGFNKEQGVAEAEGISRRGILKGIAGAGALGAAGKASAIAGAFPTPSAQAAMYKAAADSNAAQARADAAEKAKRDAQRLKQGTADIERLNKINYHGGKVTPTNAEWDGDGDFMYLDGTQYSMASRMPISGDEPRDMKLISTREGRQVYIWTRYRMKGDGGHYFYPAPADSAQINEFAPGNGDDDGLPQAEYEVYQCSLDDQFEWIGEPLMQTDRLDKAHGYAYKLWQKHPDKCFMVWQEKSQGSRGGYGPVGSVLAPSEDDITENTDYLDEK
jgi:hypothetical protein